MSVTENRARSVALKRIGLGALMWLGFFASNARALDYSGRFNLGLFSATERYATSSQGTDANDQSVLTTRGFFEAVNIGSAKQEFILDLRDKHDMYGKVDQQDLRLTQANRFAVRQFAYKSSRNNTWQWAVGRVQLPDAGLQRNDGAVIGYKMSKEFYVGLFGGLGVSKSVIAHNAPHTKSAQGGVITTYQANGGTNLRSIFAATSFYLAPSHFDNEKGSLYLFHRSMLMFSQTTYLNAIVLGIMSPESALQNFVLNFTTRPLSATEMTLGFSRLDLTLYDERRELRDALPASDYQEGRFNLRQIVTAIMSLKLKTRYGKRSADGLSRYEATAGPFLSGIVNNRLDLGLSGGVRRNYQSNDQLIRLILDFYADSFNLSLDQEVIKETYDVSGEVLNPMITTASANFYFGRNLFSGVMLQYQKDERVTVTSFLLTLGYRFGNRLLTPVRKRAPGVEDL